MVSDVPVAAATAVTPPPLANAIPAAPGQAVPMGSGQWNTGICDCCGIVHTSQGLEVGGCGLCCKGWFCPCLVVGETAEFLGSNEGVPCNLAGQGNGSKVTGRSGRVRLS